MNVKVSVFVICVEVIIYLLLYSLIFHRIGKRIIFLIGTIPTPKIVCEGLSSGR